MKILEAREGFIKLESKEKISLSSFIQITGIQKRYIAQIVQVARGEESYLASAKILFLYDGSLKNYDKTLPSNDSEITEFTFDILNKSLEYTTPIVAGRFIDGNINITIDKECFNKKLLISVDKPAVNNIILSNLAKQFPKVVVIDMQGTLDGLKYIAGRDFKLPLNTESLEFMYEDCLNDATAESKNLIKEIFNDLSEYSKTVPFLPFGALKSIVDDMVDKSHIFKLLVLKNKLAKFDKAGCFAAEPAEAANLERILTSKNSLIDLSKLDTIFQNRYLSVIYSVLEKHSPDTQVFVLASNSINKNNIKNILTNKTISSVFATHSKFKYINEIKSMFDNFIIEPTFANNEIFRIYSVFLKSMPKETYLLAGEGTNYIPLVSRLERLVLPVAVEVKEPASEQVKDVTKSEEVSEFSVEPETIDESVNSESLSEQDLEDIVEEPDKSVAETSETSSLQEEQPEEVVSEPVESPDETIEKKSDELIEKFSEEVQTAKLPEEINIFGEESNEDLVSIESPESEDITEVSVETETVEPEIVQEETESVSEEVLEPEEELLLEETPAVEPEIIENSLEDDLEKDLDQEVLEPLNLESEELAEADDTALLSLDEDSTAALNDSEGDIETIEIPEDISDISEGLEGEYSKEITTSFAERMDINTDEIRFKEYSPEDDFAPEPETEVIPLSDSDDEFDEIVELDESEISEDDIVVSFEDEEPLDEESLDKEIVEDVDKVFTTIKEDDEISDSDLDFIDELNNDTQAEELEPVGNFEELPEMLEESDEEDFLEPLEELSEKSHAQEEKEILQTRNSSTPIVPVYDADIPQEDLVMSDAIEQGDMVVHAKYGSGVVEKMIKYGTKTLYSINFDNIGRRLLDPSLTEIKKA